jgi:DNA polymerase alpha subunit B
MLIVHRLDGMIATPRAGAMGSAAKRRSNFDTPASKAHKNHEMSSPAGGATPRGEASNGPYVFVSERTA